MVLGVPTRVEELNGDEVSHSHGDLGFVAPPKGASIGSLSSKTHSLLMFVELDRYFHIGFVSNMWKSSLLPLKN
jgi:hypothetical protein